MTTGQTIQGRARSGTPLQPFPGRFKNGKEYGVAIHHHVNRLKGALGWALAVITLAYVLVVGAVGAITR